MSVETAIINMVEKNLEEMRKNIHVALTQKAVQSLEERKQSLASDYFSGIK